MKRISILCGILLLVSCISDKTVDVGSFDDLAPESIEARALNLMADFYGPATKSNARIPNVYTIGIRTKADNMDISAHVINFENNQGFVVMTTNGYNEENLIAVSDNGNIDTAVLETILFSPTSDGNAPDASGAECGGEIIGEDEEDDDENEPYHDADPSYSSETTIPFFTDDNPDITISSSSPNGHFVESIIGGFLTDNNFITIDGQVIPGGNGGSNSGNGNATSPKWTDWIFDSGVKPLIKTKWHQHSPYNNDCPIKDGSRCVAGCVAIATGQIAAYYQKPANENWSVISSFGIYRNGKYDVPSANIDIVSAYIHSIGEKLKMDYGVKNSSSNIYKAKRYVRNYMGFDARIHKWDWDRVRGRLKQNMPVYTRGTGPEGGHAWIVDGYIIQSRSDQNNVYSNQYRTLMHVNWGWEKGEYDGYYSIGVFDPATGPDAYDSTIGDSGNSCSGDTKFTKKIKTLTWSAK